MVVVDVDVVLGVKVVAGGGTRSLCVSSLQPLLQVKTDT